MAVQNLAPGAIKEVARGEIRGNVHVYRTGQGSAAAGNVGWLPNGGALQEQPLAVGHTVTFAINGAPGMIANGCPSKVQLLWDNAVAVDAPPASVRSAADVLQPKLFTTDPATQAMQTLSAQWYNAVVAGCKLDPNTFQLVQGNTPLGSTSEQLWNIFDAIPPLSVTSYFNPSQFNSFSSDYGAVINNLKAQNANKFQTDMGDYYSQWATYLKSSPTMPNPGGILQLFQNWSQFNMPPDQAQQCYTDYQQVAQGIVPIAVQMWLNAGGGAGGVKAYNNTIGNLKTALPSAPSATVSLDSESTSSDISHTWAEANVGGWYDFFAGGGSTSYDQMTTALTEAGLNIQASFDSVLTFAAGPLKQPSTDPILSAYQPWYSSAALNLAFQNNNNIVWNNTPPSWANTFGPSGNMQRMCSALVIVDGITITTTSNVGFSSSQQTQFKAAAEVGFFPFFEANVSGGWSNSVSFDSSGNVTVTSTCPQGNPNILGVIVTPIGSALANS